MRVFEVKSELLKCLESFELSFKQDEVVQGIWVDFFLDQNKFIVQITEKEHDHGEAYFAEQQEIKVLEEAGFEVFQVPVPEYHEAISKLRLVLETKKEAS